MAMLEEERQVGLYTIRTFRPDGSWDSLIEFGREISVPVPMQVRNWLADVRRHVTEALDNPETPASVREMAERCDTAWLPVFNVINRPRLEGIEIAVALRDAIDLAGEWHSFMVNSNPYVAGAVAGIQAGRDSAARLHTPERKAQVNAKWDAIKAEAKRWLEAGHTRQEILDHLSAKFFVKASTLKKKLKPGEHLPRARRPKERNPSP